MFEKSIIKNLININFAKEQINNFDANYGGTEILEPLIWAL